MADDTEGAAQADNNKGIQPQKIYLKDVSFETPNTPGIFTRDWKPALEVELDNTATAIAEDTYEVVLTVTVKASIEDSTAYLAEVHQCGIFSIRGFEPDELQRMLNVFCPRLIYPYAAAALSDLVTKGGFPQLLLAPVNFEGLYAQRLQGAQAQPDAPATLPH